jgi:hypothetical protein
VATVAILVAIGVLIAAGAALLAGTLRRFGPSFSSGSGDDDGGGLTGVREPRRPAPIGGAAFARADPDDAVFG